MNEYIPPYHITDKMLSYTALVSEKIGRITEKNGLTSKPHLRRSNKIKSIHSSLRIEANSLSLNEVKDVIDGHAVLGSAREIQEVKNAYEAYGKISAINPYSLNELKQMHGIMTKYIAERSGAFRLGEEGVFSGSRCIFIAPPAGMVPELMENLFAWMNRNKNKVHPLILSAVFHYEFVFIHPFTDGNGRMARLWHTVILSKWKPVFEYIPLGSRIEKFQDDYYKAIADCHTAGNSDKFIEFILEQIDMALNDILAQSKMTDENISEYERRLLNAMEFNVPYTANSLLTLLGLKSKETLRKNYLNPAIEHGLVTMTVPDKPKSKNQRYIKGSSE